MRASSETDDCSRTHHLPCYVISRPGQLSLLPSARRKMSTSHSVINDDALWLESTGRYDLYCTFRLNVLVAGNTVLSFVTFPYLNALETCII